MHLMPAEFEKGKITNFAVLLPKQHLPAKFGNSAGIV